ncbi:hypothetical protein PV327_007728 [Microctonus hyperodae]|uniref:RHD domain-containing protein n=1 Tax=Microctonus hyperodae TaxID=165561 RepID=A0AA39KYY1_MICHY|nr:hypothetical protein PV327_007728 [Microctonus hyperodae]
MDRKQNIRPYVEIVEQPAPRAARFRYTCEGRSASSIPGIKSRINNKTFPSIRIVGYTGPAIVVVSCVTKDEPYRAHPHSIVGKGSCNRGVCTMDVITRNLPISFINLGIQCVKKKDIAAALELREQIRVDPFRLGFDHKEHAVGIDLNVVRLCFQVFLEGPTPKRFSIPLDPVVSNPVYDKKTATDLVICKLSHCSAPFTGGMEMIILCEKIAKDDIQVVFFEKQDERIVWEAYGEFHPTDIHKQAAISFRTPPYRVQVSQPIQVFIQLRRPSDGDTSDPLPFLITPSDTGDPAYVKRKRQKFSTSSIITEPQPQQPRSQLTCHCGSENPRNNAPKDARAINIAKETYRISLLHRLQTQTDKNPYITTKNEELLKNQLVEKASNYEKSKTQITPMNNTNLAGANYPESIYHLNNDIIDLPSVQMEQLMKSCRNTPDMLSQILGNDYNNSVNTKGFPNLPITHCPFMDQSKCNEPPTLYKVTSQNQGTFPYYHQQQEQPQPQLNNYATGAMNNQANLDINSMANLYEINSVDIGNEVERLSDNFLSSISLSDSPPARNEGQHDDIAANVIENNNWLVN